MGKANRERRAAKKRKAEQRESRQRSANRAGAVSGVPLSLRDLLVVAATYPGPVPDDLFDLLYSEADRRGRAGTALTLDDLMCEALHAAWEDGWQPAELARQVRRRRGAGHADFVATAIAAAHTTIKDRAPRAWLEQLRELRAEEPWWGKGRDWLGPWSLRHGSSARSTLVIAIEVLNVLAHLPAMERVLPPPSQWRALNRTTGTDHAHVDDALLAKVRALLAKAESTNFEHEADALTAKAQELMARHAIDEAVANLSEPVGRGGRSPSLRRIPVDDPYAKPKSLLLAVVAAANGVRTVWSDEVALMTLVGFDRDLDAVEVLFTSLLMQGAKALLAKGTITDARGRSRTRSFRQSFFIAFADRIGERLFVAARQARESAEEQLGRDLLPVLAGRTQDVDDYTAKLFPNLVRVRGSAVTNRDGWVAGRVAAEMATLGQQHERLDGTNG